MSRYHAEAFSIHKGSYYGPSDPGPVGAGRTWISTATGPPYAQYVRNSLNNGWDLVGTVGGGGGGASLLDDLLDVVITDPQEGDLLTRVGLEWVNVAPSPLSVVGLTAAHTIAVYTIDPTDFDFSLGYGCEVESWSLYGNVVGSIELDIWRGTHAEWPHSDGESIVGGNYPALVGAEKARDTVLAGWTTAIGEDDTLTIHKRSSTYIDKATLVLRTART